MRRRNILISFLKGLENHSEYMLHTCVQSAQVHSYVVLIDCCLILGMAHTKLTEDNQTNCNICLYDALPSVE
jgi:hypothetical protein